MKVIYGKIMENTRNTKQKAAVYEAVCALDHPTATEVYERVKKTMPTLSRGTVFRVLGGFAESGKLRRLCLTDSDVRYDFTLAPHAHARCGKCGAVCDVFVSDSERIKENAHAEGFRIDGYELEFFGICARCLAKSSKTI